jgi:threonine/homoserine/homoserine lactone efflux protein
MPIDDLLLFIAAGLLLNLTPGPDVLTIVSNALRSGARAGMAAALGTSAGVFVHIFAAAIGVSALLVASSTAFTVLKWLGAAYLVYVGLRLLLSNNASAMDLGAYSAGSTRGASRDGREFCAGKGGARKARRGHRAELPAIPTSGELPDFKAIFLRGFGTNALNPKVALFFLAFLPQFIGPTVHNKPLAFLLLGLLFNFNCLWVNLGWAVTAAWLSRRVALVQHALVLLDRIAGALFITFGLKLALTDNPGT